MHVIHSFMKITMGSTLGCFALILILNTLRVFDRILAVSTLLQNVNAGTHIKTHCSFSTLELILML